MALPPFYEFCLPTLQELQAAPTGAKKRDLFERVAKRMSLNPADLQEIIPSGQSTFENRVGWALSYMKKIGWVDNPSRAAWALLPAGSARAQTGRGVAIDELRPGKRDATLGGDEALDGHTLGPTLTPRERIEVALAEIVADVEATVLQRMAALTPLRFEKAVLQLLDKMGYAGKFGTTTHAGQVGDGGIDGILYLDRLQLERVYVQAKRWQGIVGASVVRDFAGAMDGESATKGVILTTSSFSADARKYVEKSPKAIRLVEGKELARLMVEFETGAQTETELKIPKADEDFFDEG